MRRLLAVVLLALVSWVPGTAWAHDVLVDSDPKDGARLEEPPATVTLVFSAAVRQGYAKVTVTGSDGSAWADGEATVGKERVSVRVRPLVRPGKYVVGYRVLSSDGHPVSGKVTFTFAGGAASPAPSASAPASAPARDQAPDPAAEAAEAAANGGAGMAVVWIAGALVVLGLGTVVALRRSGGAPQAPAARAEDREGSSGAAVPAVRAEGRAPGDGERDGKARA
ncbi:copper resistance CopC family protein [Thermoactinospora rubra]|uniref:copper resistance CopC family protein n=1 Tax=Thermoactinospora rubra TaxID=1088767 RepID=UPI000A0F70D6|nr:copper resistance CopC family protein [Thermoactinospora rubra]